MPSPLQVSELSEQDWDDERAIEEMLSISDPDMDDVNLASILVDLDLNEDDFDALQVEQHIFCPPQEPTATPEHTAEPVILPFPSINLSNPGGNKVAASMVDFFQIISPHLGDKSLIPVFHADVLLQPLAQHGPSPSTNIKELEHEPARSRRQRALERKVQMGVKHAATVVASVAAYAEWPTTNGDWKGIDYRHQPAHEGLWDAWELRTIGKQMVDLKFCEVPYEGQPTWLVDKAGIAFGFRSEILKFMFKPWKDGSDSTLLADFNAACMTYIEMCGDRDQKAIDDNFRGPHWAMIIGADRQNKMMPFWTQFHRDHLEATMWLLDPAGPTMRLIQIATSIFRMRFPLLAARVDACGRHLLDLGIDADIAKPLFGLWYNYCINGARPGGIGIDGVDCRPHTDGQNLAVMMCVLFIYGNFNWHEKAWLVLWEAGLIIQLPIGVLFYYPSALFIHFNIDITDFHHYLYTTDNGETPTPGTAKSINGVKGRGSIVFFNQASIFQIAEVGLPIGEAKKRGLSTAADNEKYMAGMPMFKFP